MGVLEEVISVVPEDELIVVTTEVHSASSAAAPAGPSAGSGPLYW